MKQLSLSAHGFGSLEIGFEPKGDVAGEKISPYFAEFAGSSMYQEPKPSTCPNCQKLLAEMEG